MIETFKTIVLFIFMLLIITTVHEFGHFLAAKIFDVYVAEFSIGMGKKLYSKKGKETTFSIRALPIGGFCAIVGDNENDLEATTDVDETQIEDRRTLKGIAVWKKIIILVSGVFMNVLLALLLVSGVYLYNGQTIEAPKAVLSEISEGSAAYNAGLKKDDEIIKVTLDNGYSISPRDFSELSNFLSLYEEGYITFSVKRGEETLDIKLIPTYSNDKQTYIVGIKSYDYSVVDVNLFNCFKYGANYLIEMFKLMIITIAGLFRGVNLDGVAGPVGMYSVTSEVVSYGYTSYILLISIFSLNIGIMNLIPLPILDGGRVVITIVEGIVKKPIPKKLEKIIMTISTMIIFALLIFATSQDILRLYN